MFDKKKRAFSKALLSKLQLEQRNITRKGHNEFTFEKLYFSRATIRDLFGTSFWDIVMAAVFLPIWITPVCIYLLFRGYRWTPSKEKDDDLPSLTVFDSIKVTRILRKIKRDDKLAAKAAARAREVEEMNKVLMQMGFSMTDENKIK